MGSDRIRVSPMPALRARRAGIVVAAVLALLLIPSVASAAGAATQAGIDPGAASPTTAPVSTGGSYDTRPLASGASGAVVRMLQRPPKLAGYRGPQPGRVQSGAGRG